MQHLKLTVKCPSGIYQYIIFKPVEKGTTLFSESENAKQPVAVPVTQVTDR